MISSAMIPPFYSPVNFVEKGKGVVFRRKQRLAMDG
jgi:hypothetical protein